MIAQKQQQALRLHVEQKLIQATRLLLYNSVELEQEIEQELMDNPALERVDTLPAEMEGRWSQPKSFARVKVEDFTSPLVEDDPLANLPDEEISLREYLRREIHLILSSHQYPIALYLIDNLDERGLLPNFDIDRASLETGASPEEIEDVLRALQTLDPPGIGARSIQECMLIQLRYLREQGEGHPLAEQIVERYFHRLLHPPIRRIARDLQASSREVQKAIDYIRRALHPYPAYRFRSPWTMHKTDGVAPLRPDVIIQRSPHGFEVEIARPRWTLIVNPEWRLLQQQIRQAPRSYPEETVRQVEQYISRAEQFLHYLEMRSQTLRRVTLMVIQHQFAFLETGSPVYLQPLTRAYVARQLNLHESTISRAISNKWVLLPNEDLVPFSYFFTPSLSVRQAIAELVRSEDPRHPLSDQQIAELLYERWGIQVTRRTVVKHRNRLHIPSSRERKRNA